MGESKQTLKFICIGAAKSGTTTLHELIKNHPEITVPKAKEVPYFNNDIAQKRGFDWYLRKNFTKTQLESTVCGTVTPQYMYYRGVSTEETAKKIKRQLPKVKLVVILRHPIERAFSHFKTSVRRSGETRSFSQAIDELLNSKDLDKQRLKTWDATNRFLFASEYGKILNEYYALFGRQNILVLYTNDLKNKPGYVLDKFFQFINVKQGYRPSNIHGQHNKGGMKPKLAILTPKYLYKIPFFRKFWRNFIPYRLRKFIEVRVNSWNAKADKTKLDKESEVYIKLIKFYANDVKFLEKKIGSKVPWSEWR